MMGWHDQNICNQVAVEDLHRSHVGSVFGYIFASFSLVRWRRWTILNWIRPCLAEGDEECTRPRIKSHWSPSNDWMNSSEFED
jgi:hypothetical protein